VRYTLLMAHCNHNMRLSQQDMPGNIRYAHPRL
jgi:hypothetical protein